MLTFLGSLLLLKLINKLFYGPRSTAPSPQHPTVSTSTLKILEFNASWHPHLICFGSSDHSQERSSLLLDRLTSYDIVSLHECFSYAGSPVSGFVHSLKQRGFAYVARSPPAGIFAMEIIDGGILFFSKYPILMHEYLKFDLSVGTEEWIAKGSLYARVQTGAGTHIHFFAVSTQPTHAKSRDDCAVVRFHQWRELRTQINQRASDGQPIIVLGDFNSDALAPEVRSRQWKNEYARLIETFTKPSYRLIDTLLESYGEHVPTYGVADAKLTPKEDVGTKQRTDYILVLSREDGEYTMTGHNTEVVPFEVGNERFSNLSSHYGVTTDVLLSRTSEPKI